MCFHVSQNVSIPHVHCSSPACASTCPGTASPHGGPSSHFPQPLGGREEGQGRIIPGRGRRRRAGGGMHGKHLGMGDYTKSAARKRNLCGFQYSTGSNDISSRSPTIHYTGDIMTPCLIVVHSGRTTRTLQAGAPARWREKPGTHGKERETRMRARTMPRLHRSAFPAPASARANPKQGSGEHRRRRSGQNGCHNCLPSSRYYQDMPPQLLERMQKGVAGWAQAGTSQPVLPPFSHHFFHHPAQLYACHAPHLLHLQPGDVPHVGHEQTCATILGVNFSPPSPSFWLDVRGRACAPSHPPSATPHQNASYLLKRCPVL